MSRWVAPAALVIAVVAVALAIWALVSASSTGSGNSGTALAGDPKTRVCTAFGTVTKAAVAANARLALFGGGQSMLDTLDSETPAELADPVRSFGNALQEISMYALAGVANSDPAQSARLVEADSIRQQVADLCK